jgi:hypothetical protein
VVILFAHSGGVSGPVRLSPRPWESLRSCSDACYWSCACDWSCNRSSSSYCHWCGRSVLVPRLLLLDGRTWWGAVGGQTTAPVGSGRGGGTRKLQSAVWGGSQNWRSSDSGRAASGPMATPMVTLPSNTALRRRGPIHIRQDPLNSSCA